MSADFRVENYGNIFLLRTLSAAGDAWAEEHLPLDCPVFGAAFVIEHRYIADIVAGIQGDGLEVV